MQVRLISKTVGYDNTEYVNRTIDEIIVGEARISSSRETNELFNEPHKLLRHCLLNGHWSVFEMANLTFEIKTSRAMGRELLRHCKMVGVQEYSQRYAPVIEFEEIELRKQCKNNRQSSTEIVIDTFDYAPNEYVKQHIEQTSILYNLLLETGISKESARFISLESAQTTLIMNFRVREVITFLNARLHNTAQKECRLVAEAIRDIFIEQCPIISKALYQFEYAEQIHILDRLTLEKFSVFDFVKQNNFKPLKK